MSRGWGSYMLQHCSGNPNRSDIKMDYVGNCELMNYSLLQDYGINLLFSEEGSSIL